MFNQVIGIEKYEVKNKKQVFMNDLKENKKTKMIF
jgi:hypothetical protein